jgi:glycyl-tRNA synthetase beta subunit
MSMHATLLVELLTEELPPKALSRLGEVEKLMPVSVALDAEGKPTPALLKKMEAKGIPPMRGAASSAAWTARPRRCSTPPPWRVPARRRARGHRAGCDQGLPIPKVMRWGDGDATFVRPVHKLTCCMAPTWCRARARSGFRAHTRGHRFMSRGDIDIATADAYEPTLLAEGKVIPNFAERRADIERQLLAEAAKQGALLNEYADLLDEVAALVEHPTVYVGEFEAEFLAVPQECLILTMRANQKYFPLFDGAGKLLNRFLIVSNMRVADPSNIITGNARVVRPRLSDARFFFEQDKKQPLETASPGSRRWSITTSSAASSSASSVSSAGGRDRRANCTATCRGEARRAPGQGRPRHRHGGRVSRAAGHHGPLLRARRRRGRGGGRRHPGSTISRALPAMRCPRAMSPPRWRWPTSSMRWSASSASAWCRPATRIRSRCAAPRSACCAS